MAATEDELVIRSRHGLLRDLVPIYSLRQFVINLVIVGFIFGLNHWLGYFPPVIAVIVMLGWVFQFVSRPCTMTIAREQANWLVTVLEAQGFYRKSESDERWRTLEASWWQRWPHQFIEFIPGEPVTIIAPRDVMDSIRDSLELVEEHSELSFSSEERPFAFEPPVTESHLPWHMQIPSAALGTAWVVAWVWTQFTSAMQGMIRWGLSASALSAGRFETIFLHMFAHGNIMHLMMNTTTLAAIGATLTARLGQPPLNWLRFLLLFFLSGLAGASLYLAVHPTGTVPMVGASGGLYGLIGLLIRTSANGGTVLAVKSKRIRRIGWDLIKQNAFLFALLALMSWLNGTAGGLAWEAHLGGFLFGLCIGPNLLPRAAVKKISEQALSETNALVN